MSDESFGLKISLPGYDVNSATPEQCSVHSHYDTFKIAFDAPSPLEGNLLVTFQDNPSQGTYPVFVINTNYDYIPAVYFFNDIRTSSTALGAEVGSTFFLDEDSINYFQLVINPPQIIFQLVIGETGFDVLTGEYFAFKYYVFAENGI